MKKCNIIIIFSSLFLLIFSVFLGINVNNEVLSNSKDKINENDVELDNESEVKINDFSVDNEDDDTNTDEENNKESTDEEIDEDTDLENEDNSSNGGTSYGNSTINNNNNSTNENVVVDPNKQLAIDIKNKYGVVVTYKDDAYLYGATKVYDDNKINVALNKLNIYLAKFPKSVLNALINSNGYSIQLFEDVGGGKDGFAIYQVYGEHRIALNVDFSERLLYHETYHIMEIYMYYKNGSVDPFTNWTSYNPAGFTYGYTSDKNYVGLSDTWSNAIDISFVSTYAKSAPVEDRAELFSDLMFRTRKYKYMNAGYGVHNKAVYLTGLINSYFNTNNNTWDRWI